MGFNRNELQPDDDFNFDDDFDFDEPAADARSATGSGKRTTSSRSVADDDFSFDDDFSSDNVIDDDDGGGIDFNTDEDDMPDFDRDGRGDEENGGGRRPFIILAAVLIALFLCALVSVGLIATGVIRIPGIGGPTELELTATAIVATNQAVETQVAIRSTDQAIAGATQTAIALIPTETPTPTPTETPTIPPSQTPVPTVDETQGAAFAIQTQVVIDATQTAIALAATPTQAPLDANAIAITATYLAGFLQPTVATTQIAIAPTQEVSGGTPTGPLPTALPNTGFFDDATGSGGLGLLLLMAGALVGVIFVSRRLRTT
jgi:hypothetical protein